MFVRMQQHQHCRLLPTMVLPVYGHLQSVRLHREQQLIHLLRLLVSVRRQRHLTITVNPIVTPAFDPFGALCLNATAPTLPLTSNNGITGTWNPATISTAAVGTTTYTFTPDCWSVRQSCFNRYNYRCPDHTGIHCYRTSLYWCNCSCFAACIQ